MTSRGARTTLATGAGYLHSPSPSLSVFSVCLRICSTCSYLGGGELEFAYISIECGTGKTMEEQSHRHDMKQ